MKQPNRNRRLLPIIIAIVLLAVTSTWLARQHQQSTLNRELIAAIKQSNATAVDSLLAAGADPNARDGTNEWETMLQMLTHLFKRRPSYLWPTAIIVALDQRDSDDAIPPQSVAIVRVLLTNGANVNAPNRDWNTPIASLLAHHRMLPPPFVNRTTSTVLLDILLNAGADIEALGPGETTPLMAACGVNEPDCVRILLDHGANPNPRPNLSGTPLSAAEECGYIDITKLLKSHGAKR